MSQPREAFDGLPAPAPTQPDQVIDDLGDGLLLRRATERDIDAIAEFQAVVHQDPPDFEPQPFLVHWTRELMDGSHPRASARDWLLVHDTTHGRIAAAQCLVPMEARFSGVPLRAAQVELVGTHPEHRRRGLIRRMMNEMHGWADAAGCDLTLIDGIPWYYRQFGYEMAVEDRAARNVPRGALPRERPDEASRVKLRRATADDLARFERLYARGTERHRLAFVRGQTDWRFELSRHAEGARYRELWVIEDGAAHPVGVMSHTPILWPPGWLHLNMIEVEDDVAWSDVMPGVLWHLRTRGLEQESRQGIELLGATLSLGTEHPCYEAIRTRLTPGHPGYALYLRVPDVRGFVEKVTPALEANLAASDLAGHSGSLALSFYRDGVRLELERGRISSVTSWRPATDDPGDLAFPDLTYLHLLFGHRSWSELYPIFADVFAWKSETVPLLNALFPKQPSDPWTPL